MKSKDIYGVQTYLRDRKGALVRGLATSCRNADEARREAERRAAGRSAVGATAFWQPASCKFHEGANLITLAAARSVPQEVEPILPI